MYLQKRDYQSSVTPANHMLQFIQQLMKYNAIRIPEHNRNYMIHQSHLVMELLLLFAKHAILEPLNIK